MKPIKQLNNIIIPCCIMVLLLGQSCMNVQKMRYSRGFNISFSKNGNEAINTPPIKKAAIAKKHNKKELLKTSDTATSALGTQVEIQELASSENPLIEEPNYKFTSQFKTEHVNKKTVSKIKHLRSTKSIKQPLFKNISLKKTDQASTQGKDGMGWILLMSLLSTVLAVIAIFCVAYAVSFSSTFLWVLAFLFAISGVIVASEGYDKAKLQPYWFRAIYFLLSLPSFLANVIIVILCCLLIGK